MPSSRSAPGRPYAGAYWVERANQPSGENLTLCTYPFLRHARESGHPGATDTAPEALGPRLRGGDEEEKIGVICLVRTTSIAPRQV